MTETPHSVGLGAALRVLRTTAELTIEQAAEVAGVSPSYLSRAENNLVTPTPGWVQHVTTVLGDQITEKPSRAAS